MATGLSLKVKTVSVIHPLVRMHYGADELVYILALVDYYMHTLTPWWKQHVLVGWGTLYNACSHIEALVRICSGAGGLVVALVVRHLLPLPLHRLPPR